MVVTVISKDDAELKRVYLANLKKLQMKLQLLFKHAHFSGPEKIHQIRVEGRRLGAAVFLARHADPKISCRKLNRKVQNLCKDLTKIRELDVAIKNAKVYRVKIPNLKERYLKAEKKAQRALQRKKRKRILDDLSDLIMQVRSDQNLKLAKAVRRMVEKIKPSMIRPLTSDHDSHRFRLGVKDLRYTLEMIGQHPIRLIRIQKQLGETRDLKFLQSLLSKSPVSGSP